MAKRLQQHISSAYFEAANQLTSKQARRKVVAYVEGYEDIFFWRSVLSELEDEEHYFEVMLPSRQHKIERGKKAAISRLLSDVGEDMIACVDADYDYLLQGVSHLHLCHRKPAMLCTFPAQRRGFGGTQRPQHL